MHSKAALGMFFMVLQAVIINALLVVLRTMKDLGWPETTMYSERKWVFLAGSFWSASFVMLTFSVQMKTPLGDVAALTSINVVVAALLGRMFLGESLRFIHLGSVACSVTGALLISKPDVFFGGKGSVEGTPLLGYGLATASGFFDACILISSRKSTETSSWFHALSSEAQSSAAFLFLAFSPFVDGLKFQPVVASPFRAAGWIAALLTLDTLNIIVYCTAAQWCPVAVSATVNTAANMIFGYAAQLLFFESQVQPTSIAGALLMLLGVGAMALVRESQQSDAPPGGIALEPDGTATSGGHNVATAEDEVESIASFVATEFVDQQPRLRFFRSRNTGASVNLEASMIGIVSA